MSHLIEVVTANAGLFAALAALLVSEVLPHIKSVEANSVMQLLLAMLKRKAGPVAVLLVVMSLSGCACMRPASPEYNGKACVVERQVLDCTKGSAMSLLPLVPSIVLAIVSGVPVDWVAIGLAAGKGGLANVACIAAAIEADYMAPAPAFAHMPMEHPAAAIVRDRAHDGVASAMRAAFGPGPMSVKVPRLDGSSAMVVIK